MNTNVKLFLLVLMAGGIVLGIYSCNKAKSDKQSDSGEAISTSYSVSVVQAARLNVAGQFSQVGTIAGYNDVMVVSETSGRVVKVDAEVGDFKKAGSVLVEVDSELKEAAFKAAQVSYEKAQKDIERYESLYKEASISDNHAKRGLVHERILL